MAKSRRPECELRACWTMGRHVSSCPKYKAPDYAGGIRRWLRGWRSKGINTGG